MNFPDSEHKDLIVNQVIQLALLLKIMDNQQGKTSTGDYHEKACQYIKDNTEAAMMAIMKTPDFH